MCSGFADMPHSALAPVSAATELANVDSVLSQFQPLLHDSTLAMSRGVSVPPVARGIFYEVTRGRRAHLLGSYPMVASAFASRRAPFANVCAPMTALKSFLWLTFYRPQLPPFMEANARETDANGHLDHKQHQAISDPHDAALAALVDACTQQIEETRTLRSVALSMMTRRMS